MTLIIKTVSYKGMPLSPEISARFEAQGGSIGRSPDNQMVLPDAEKYISRRHAEIHYEGGRYFIQDSSAAGTYLEQQGQLLQQGRAVLMDGERLRIGEYELQVTIIESAPMFSEPYAAAPPVRQLDFADALEGPFAAPQTPVPVADRERSFIEQPDSSIFHQSFTPPEPQGPAPATAGVKDDLDFGDLLSTLDNLSASQTAPPAASPSLPPDFPELPADFFADADKPDAEFALAAAPPRAEIDVPASPFTAAATEHAGFEAAAAPVSPVAASPVEATGLDRQADASMPLTPAAFAPMPEAAPQRPPEPAQSVPADSELIRAFLAGAGIDDPQFLPPEHWPELLRTSGELLRSMVDGLMCVLRARAELKSQFRVSVTTMRSVDNNPLKFTPNVDDALRLILAPTHAGFLSPKDAVREGFGDIMNHQMAVTAGIQAALTDVLRGFDPELIEKAQGEGLLFQKKAKCWEHYASQYPKLKAAAQEDFFGDAFGDAYERQMQLLSRSSKR